MKGIAYIFIFLISTMGFAQNEILKTVAVDAAGWKRVARLDGGAGRGYNEVTLMTHGGASQPRVAKISWFKGWSSYGGLNLVSVSDNGHWSEARITSDGVKAHLEVNFTTAIPSLKVYLNQAAWVGGDILDSPLPNGGDAVIVSATFGRANYGEDDFFLDYNGRVGIGTGSPSELLDVNGNIKANRMIKIDGKGSVASLQIMDNSNTNTLDILLRGDGGDSFIKAGDVGIGTTTPDSKLTVKGKIHAEEVKVDLSVPGPDYVFKEDYDLKSLEEVQNYIKEHGHLPNIPSAVEMEVNGIQLGEMNMKLLEKIEELTLYALEQQERIQEFKKQLENKNSENDAMKEELKVQRREIEQIKKLIKNNWE